MDVTLKDVQISVSGALVEQAQNQPLAKERIEKQMHKTGATCFQFEQLEIQMDSDIFVPMQAINEIRRNALDELEREILKPYERKVPKNSLLQEETKALNKEKTNRQPVIHASVETKEQLENLLTLDEVQGIYIDSSMFSIIDWKQYLQSMEECMQKLRQAGKKAYYYMPAIFRADTRNKFSKFGKELLALPMDGVVIRNLESLVWLKEQGYTGKIISDYNLYTFNKEAEEFLRENGVEITTLPLELNEYEMKEVNQGMYYLPYMDIFRL